MCETSMRQGANCYQRPPFCPDGTGPDLGDDLYNSVPMGQELRLIDDHFVL